MKKCSKCSKELPEAAFRRRKDNGRLRNECRACERVRQTVTPTETQETERDPQNPRDLKEIAMKRMLSAAKTRAKDKGLMFDIHYEDIRIPNLCPILKIPMIPSTDGTLTDNSPSLDRLVPYLGYTKGNVRVISMKANRIKTDATSAELEAVLKYVKQIEDDNT